MSIHAKALKAGTHAREVQRVRILIMWWIREIRLLPGIILTIAQYKANKCDCQKNPGEQGGNQDGLFVAEYRYQRCGHNRCNEEQKRLDDMPCTTQLHGNSDQSGAR